jgi:hypothetical protein
LTNYIKGNGLGSHPTKEEKDKGEPGRNLWVFGFSAGVAAFIVLYN